MSQEIVFVCGDNVVPLLFTLDRMEMLGGTIGAIVKNYQGELSTCVVFGDDD
jgi:hypothetical protein